MTYDEAVARQAYEAAKFTECYPTATGGWWHLDRIGRDAWSVVTNGSGSQILPTGEGAYELDYGNCDWPTDAEVSAAAGKALTFFDGRGDNPDHPEVIYHAAERQG